MNGAWYFAAREGEQGPFSTEEHARSEVDRFLSDRQALASFQQAREQGARRPLSLSLEPLDDDRPAPALGGKRKVVL